MRHCFNLYDFIISDTRIQPDETSSKKERATQTEWRKFSKQSKTESNEWFYQLESFPEKPAEETKSFFSLKEFDDPRSFCTTWKMHLLFSKSEQKLSLPKLMNTVIKSFINSRERNKFSSIYSKDIHILENTNGLITYFVHCETSEEKMEDLPMLQSVLLEISQFYQKTPDKFEACENDEIESYSNFSELIEEINKRR